MSATDRLDQIEARANDTASIVRAAYNNRTVTPHPDDEWAWGEGVRAGVRATLERTDPTVLVAALRAVLELHHETTAWAPPDETQATECAQGCTDSEGFSDYPCPTVRAIEEALS